VGLYLLENSAIKLLLLLEGEEFWVRDLFTDRGIKGLGEGGGEV
jgi:hypothetical protein